MKVIVAGSRNFNNYTLLSDTLNPLKQEISEIVCGEAKGADTLGRIWAENNNIPVKSFPAQWDIYGKRAGYLRNEDMGNYADYLVAFWDGKSKGTNHMIEMMKKLKKHGKVIIYE